MSADEAEAARCLRELAVPFFHHEVVKQALLLAMEEPAVQAPLLALLAHMAESGLVSGSQMQKACSCCCVLSSLCVRQVKSLLAGRVAAGAARTYMASPGCCPAAWCRRRAPVRMLPVLHIVGARERRSATLLACLGSCFC